MVALQVSVILNNAGIMIVYLIIMGDVLVGVGPDYSGLVTTAAGIHTGDVWWLNRPFVVWLVQLRQCLLACKMYVSVCPAAFVAFVIPELICRGGWKWQFRIIALIALSLVMWIVSFCAGLRPVRGTRLEHSDLQTFGIAQTSALGVWGLHTL